MRPLTIGSLFSGIGGLDLGLECALRDEGFNVSTTWQCEQDAWCRGILARHWPHAVRYVDVRTVGAGTPRVDILEGGFPCQDVSVAGKGAGLAGARSGLWFEFARIARELRPRIVVVENVAALLSRGLDTVLGDLSEAGYDALWFDLRASDVGAPHRRERLFIVAWRRDVGDGAGARREGLTGGIGADARRVSGVAAGAGPDVADCDGGRCERERLAQHADESSARGCEPHGCGARGWRDGARVADAERHDAERHGRSTGVARTSCPAQGEARQRERRGDAACGRGEALAGVGLADPCGAGLQGHGHVAGGVRAQHAGTRGARGRVAERGLGGAVDGLPRGLDITAHRWPAGPGEAQHEDEAPRVTTERQQRRQRLKALGNAVVPQQAYVVGSVVAEVLRAIGGAA